MTPRQILGEQLRSRREKMGLSQGAAAALACPPLTQKAVSHIETAACDVALSTVLSYAAALRCRLEPVP